MFQLLPVPLTDYIAQQCDLPGLFIGTYGNTTIEYMHCSRYVRPKNIPDNDTALYLVIRSNHWLRALRLHKEAITRKLSPLIDLSGEDEMFEQLKRYKHFPDNPALKRGAVFRLRSLFFIQGSVLHHNIPHPDIAPEPSPLLNDAFTRLQADIKTRLADPTTHLSPALNHHDLPGYDADTRTLNTSFLRRYEVLSLFGQSGLFGQPDAPHDTDYILQVDRPLQRQSFRFVKTRRYFRGIRRVFRVPFRSNINPMLEFDAPIDDWQPLIEASHQSTLYNRSVPCHVRVRLSLKHRDLYTEFDLPDNAIDEPVISELWHLLHHLITQFPED